MRKTVLQRCGIETGNGGAHKALAFLLVDHSISSQPGYPSFRKKDEM